MNFYSRKDGWKPGDTEKDIFEDETPKDKRPRRRNGTVSEYMDPLPDSISREELAQLAQAFLKKLRKE